MSRRGLLRLVFLRGVLIERSSLSAWGCPAGRSSRRGIRRRCSRPKGPGRVGDPRQRRHNVGFACSWCGSLLRSGSASQGVDGADGGPGGPPPPREGLRGAAGRRRGGTRGAGPGHGGARRASGGGRAPGGLGGGPEAPEGRRHAARSGAEGRTPGAERPPGARHPERGEPLCAPAGGTGGAAACGGGRRAGPRSEARRARPSGPRRAARMAAPPRVAGPPPFGGRGGGNTVRRGMDAEAGRFVLSRAPGGGTARPCGEAARAGVLGRGSCVIPGGVRWRRCTSVGRCRRGKVGPWPGSGTLGVGVPGPGCTR